MPARLRMPRHPKGPLMIGPLLFSVATFAGGAPALPPPPPPAPVVRTVQAVAPAVPAVPVPAGVPSKDNAPLVPGHWTQSTDGNIYRDPSPGIEAYPTVGANDPAYEAGLTAALCAAKPWNC